MTTVKISNTFGSTWPLAESNSRLKPHHYSQVKIFQLPDASVGRVSQSLL